MIQGKWSRYLLSLLSGLLMTVSFPFTGSLTPLVFVCWIPLLMIEEHIRKNSYPSGKVWIHAYITFLVFNIGTTWWIWNASKGGAMLAFFLNALLMALTFLCYHLVVRRIKVISPLIVLLSVWISFEYLHHRWELSWPWLSFGNFFSIRTHWIQWYSMTGMLGGTAWILIVNYLLFNILNSVLKLNFPLRSVYFKGILTFLFIVGPIWFSLDQYHSYRVKKDSVEVVLVQPNINPYSEKFITPIGQQLHKLVTLADPKISLNTSFVIAPETALSSTFFEEDFPQYNFFRFLKLKLHDWKHVTLYTGASTARYFSKRHSRASVKLADGPGFVEYYNSSLLLKPDGDYAFLHKSKLVLGVEKIPFSDWLPFLEELSISNGGTSGTLGVEREAKTLHNSNLAFAPLICYESIYGNFCAEQCRKGAEAIFVITNDGWWGDTPGYKQHMSFSRLRAVENRRDLARSANTGISCFIDQRGEVIKHTKWWRAEAINGNINRNKNLTFYSKKGDLIGKYALFLAIGFILFSLYLSLRALYKTN